MTERTYYDVLGVAADAPDIVIKAAFRALAKEYHPDRAGGQAMDPEKFIEIQNAYAVLSNPESRGEYDARLRPPIWPEALSAIAQKNHPAFRFPPSTTRR